MADVTLTVDGRQVRAPAGTLLIEACKNAGIEVPSFCYYPGLSLQGACRMCLVEIAKMPKLQTACTVPVTEGMEVTTQSETVRQARKAMLEFVLQNHPLDCPVCDAGGQCELQDATLTYGASESKLIDFKNHRDEREWSPVVYFDRPRCIMCYHCVVGYDVAALSRRGEWVHADMGQSRGVQSGEADRHAVWLREQGLEPQLGGFDPRAILDEIQQLVPGYDSDHTQLRVEPRERFETAIQDSTILSSQDDLFSSGTLGRYSQVLNRVLEHDLTLPYEQ
jgi:hypothetical protein